MAARVTHGWLRSALVIPLGFLLAASAPAFPQAGQDQPPPPPPPKQEPPPKTGGHDGGGSGVSTGVGVNLGDVIGLFRKHVKIHLDASPGQAQAGDPIAFSTTVTPNAPGLTYEYHWSKDKNSAAEPERIPRINHAYSSAGDYKAWVVVYRDGQKVGNSNEVKIKVTPYVAATPPPPPDKVPPPIKPEPKPVVVQNPPAPTNTTASNNEPKPPQPTPEPVKTQTSNPPKNNKPSTPPPKIAPPPEPATTATTPPADNIVPPPPPRKIEYSLSLYYNPHPEAGKPVDFRAELTPAPPAGEHVRYCFSWGDGDPPSCQNSPTAVHEYRSKGRYMAAVDAYANEEQVASREEKLATSGPVQIEAISSNWLLIVSSVALFLLVAAATYGTYKVRKMMRFTVRVNPGMTRHAIPADVRPSGDVLRIRCVRSGARTEVIFTSERSAHV